MAVHTGTTRDLHLQDWAIIVEALTAFGGNPREIDTTRQERAWDCIDVIAAGQGVQAAELLRQLDTKWPQRD